jgi:hypothetical protein
MNLDEAKSERKCHHTKRDWHAKNERHEGINGEVLYFTLHRVFMNRFLDLMTTKEKIEGKFFKKTLELLRNIEIDSTMCTLRQQ